MATEPDDNPLEQLLDLFVYAPVGMLYEYPDVLPKLIKRGKSQVKLAKFVGQVAIKQQQRGSGLDSLPIPADAVAGVLAKVVTDIGSAIGLAPSGPSSNPERAPADTNAESTADEEAEKPEPKAKADKPKKAAGSGAKAKPARQRLPIASYDDLTAKEVVFLLEDLTVSQLKRVADYEKANRGRKTILGKIDRLLT